MSEPIKLMYLMSSNQKVVTKLEDGKCVYTGKTAEELEHQYRFSDRVRVPLQVVSPMEMLERVEQDLHDRYDAIPPKEVTQAERDMWFGAVPPEWSLYAPWGGGFRVSEYMEHDRTRHVIRIGNRFFTAIRKVGTHYIDIAKEAAKHYKFDIMELGCVAEDQPEVPQEAPWTPESHWDDHPEHAHADWVEEVKDNNTRQSYVEWVRAEIEQKRNDEKSQIG